MFRRRIFRPVASAAAALPSRTYGFVPIVEERKHIVFINGPITDDTASAVVMKLLSAADIHEKIVHLFINSPGGVVSAGLAIYDVMQLIPNTVSTVCLGQASSMASLLLAAGLPPCPSPFPHQASDVAIHSTELLKTRKSLYGIYARHMHQPIRRIKQLMERDTFMSPAEAKKFGLVDKVVKNGPITVGSRGGCDGSGGRQRWEA